MASALLTPALAAPPRSVRPYSARADETPRWPVAATRRWGLRLLLAVPYLALAGAVAARGITSADNEEIEASGELIAWGSRDLGTFVGSMYPPIPAAIAGALPGGSATLGFVGALVAGIVLHALWERLHLRDCPSWLALVLLLTFAASPVLGYLVTQDLSGFVGLGLFSIALVGFLRFASAGDTEGGFICGLALGVGVACDSVTILYALFLGAAAAPVALHRYRGQPHSARSSALVIIFPAAAALAGWTFLEWRFTGEALAWLRSDPDVFRFAGGPWSSFVDSMRSTLIAVALSPIFLITQLHLSARRKEAALVAILPVLGMTISLWLGLRVAAGHTLVLLAIIGLVSIPRSPNRRTSFMLAAAAVIGFSAVVMRVSTTDGVVKDWLAALV